MGSNSTTIHGLLIDNISNLQVVNQILVESIIYSSSGKKLYISYMTGSYKQNFGVISNSSFICIQ